MAEQAPTSQDSAQKSIIENGSSSANQEQANNQNEDADSSTVENADEPKSSEESIEQEQKQDKGDEAEAVGAEDEVDDEEDIHDDEAEVTSEEAAGESGRLKSRKSIVKRAMEYALTDMYPEVNILIERKRKEWDFQDPDLIRALWLETKTNALADWKVGHALVAKRKKPTLAVQENNAYKLRRQHLETQKEQLQIELVKAERIHNRKPPEFAEVKLATNTTTQIRYNYMRNNPPVPHYFLTHYAKFKKPPFLTYGIASKGCQPHRRTSR